MIFQATIFSLKRLEILQIDCYLHGILLLGSRITLSTWLVEMHITLAGLGVIVFLQIQGQSNWSLLLFHKEQEIPSIRRSFYEYLLKAWIQGNKTSSVKPYRFFVPTLPHRIRPPFAHYRAL
ncbi:uncharacterized protein [Gossypium hirsutum]|uniref:Uncharacterized protein isoform X1 n=2 Tax=Gossypium hirsutum TaxID=3635 RepID=A0ABM3BMH5_GOSHI|nr:uncharacterized protein LOC121229094 isoform X1 [Gossypium hirsutum]XP_040968260.1 uncharacterized protein LOC121229094 isoform X1 [Gossypium hirsutum]